MRLKKSGAGSTDRAAAGGAGVGIRRRIGSRRHHPGLRRSAHAWRSIATAGVSRSWAGVRLVRRVDAANVYRIIDALMLLVGLKLVCDGLVALR